MSNNNCLKIYTVPLSVLPPCKSWSGIHSCRSEYCNSSPIGWHRIVLASRIWWWLHGYQGPPGTTGFCCCTWQSRSRIWSHCAWNLACLDTLRSLCYRWTRQLKRCQVSDRLPYPVGHRSALKGKQSYIRLSAFALAGSHYLLKLQTISVAL